MFLGFRPLIEDDGRIKRGGIRHLADDNHPGTSLTPNMCRRPAKHLDRCLVSWMMVLKTSIEKLSGTCLTFVNKPTIC